MNNKLIPLLLIFLALWAGCLSGSDLSTEEIQSRLIAANTGLKSYRADIKMDIIMGMDMMGQRLEFDSSGIMRGDYDRPNKKMMMKGTITSNSQGMKAEIEAETYVLDGYVYTKVMNIWMKMKLDDDVWSQQDKVEEITELVQSGGLERLSDEKMGGESYYVIRLNPDLEKLAEIALEQQQNTDFSDISADFNEVIKNYSVTLWVNKKTFVGERAITHVEMVLPADEDAGSLGEISFDMTMDVTISDIGKEVKFTLPPEAANAVDVTESQ